MSEIRLFSAEFARGHKAFTRGWLAVQGVLLFAAASLALVYNINEGVLDVGEWRGYLWHDVGALLLVAVYLGLTLYTACTTVGPREAYYIEAAHVALMAAAGTIVGVAHHWSAADTSDHWVLYSAEIAFLLLVGLWLLAWGLRLAACVEQDVECKKQLLPPATGRKKRKRPTTVVVRQ